MTPHNREVDAREGYAIWASFYDEERNPLIMTEEPLVRQILQTLPRPARVLDVATGTGRWALYLARQGADVTGFDQSPEMLAVAKRKAAESDLPIAFVQGALEDGLPFPAAQFDVVMCALALSHVPDLRSAILVCGRVVRPGGHLLITDFHPQAIKNGWEPTVVRGEESYILPHPEHSAAEYIEAVEESGCEVRHVQEVLVREQPPESIFASDVEAFLDKHGDWPMCLIVLGCRRDGTASLIRAQTPSPRADGT